MGDNDLILGRKAGATGHGDMDGTARLGRLVTYPSGVYQEVGNVFMDIASPHCILVLGKRGMGKSHTMGAIMEEFLSAPADIKRRTAIVVIDTMSVFHGLKTLDDTSVSIFLPELALTEGSHLYSDAYIKLRPSDLDVWDWVKLFNLRREGPTAFHLLDILSSMDKGFSLDDVLTALSKSSMEKHIKLGLTNMFTAAKRTGLFDETASPIERLIKGGKLSIFDVSTLRSIRGFDARSLVVSVIARRLMDMRLSESLSTAQCEAGLLTARVKDEKPLVYMFIDEAHLFLPEGRNTLASDTLIDWIKLGRHPGLSLVLATQEPAAIHPSAISQSDIIISHSLTARDDVEALGRAKQTFMTESRDIQKIASEMEPVPGLAVVFDDWTRSTVMCRVRQRTSHHGGGNPTALDSPHTEEEALWEVL